MKKEITSKNKEIILTLFISVIILVAALAVYFYWPESDQDNGTPSIDRSVKFPKDEGFHDDYFETWELFCDLETASGKRIKVLSTCANYTSPGAVNVGYQFLDMDNITDDGDYIVFTEEGVLGGKIGELDMQYSGANTFTSLEKLDDKEYSLIIGHGSLELRLSLTLEKDSVLIGEDGKIYKSDFGTLFGYYQPNFNIQGELYKGETKISDLSGKGWLEDLWEGDLMPLSKEEWQIQLDNSVEILISKGFTPNEDYPNDLFLHTINIIRNDGKLITPRLGDEIFISYERYKIIPADDLQKRAWSYRWVIYNDDINLTIYPSPEKSIHEWSYLGFCHVNGVYYGESVSGSGICEMSKRYVSEPGIEKLTNNFNSLKPREPVEVYANLTYNPPIDLSEIILEYRVNEEEWKQIHMAYIDYYWTATIPAQDYGDEVEYRVSVTDLAGKNIDSDIETYYIEYT